MPDLFSLERMMMLLVKYKALFLDGFVTTVAISFFAVLLAAVFGIMLMFLKTSKYKVVSFLAGFYIDVIRSTPLLVQAMIIYSTSSILKLRFPSIFPGFNVFMWGIIIVCFNSSAYIAEIMRGGVNAVDVGQSEAAATLGMKKWQIMRHVVLPQAVRNILPALANEFVTVIKETSVLSVIGVHDIMFRAGDVAGITYRYIEPYIIAAALYFIIVYPLSKLIAVFERKLNKSVKK